MIKSVSPQTSFLGFPIASASFLQFCRVPVLMAAPASAGAGSPISDVARVPALLRAH